MLDFVCPSNKGSHGFCAYYDKCSIRELTALGRQNALEVISVHRYYLSGYLGIFFPAYAIWRLWLLLNYAVNRERAAETFTIIFRKPVNTGREEISLLKPCAEEQLTAHARRYSQNLQAVKQQAK
jgi:hypothetical protein